MKKMIKKIKAPIHQLMYGFKNFNFWILKKYITRTESLFLEKFTPYKGKGTISSVFSIQYLEIIGKRRLRIENNRKVIPSDRHLLLGLAFF